jgi:suppressor of tumorigenicity protein 13
MSDAQIELLKHFVSICDKDPSILHTPKLQFYREYLERLGAIIPPAPTSEPDNKPTKTKSKPSDEDIHEEQMEEEEEGLALPELDQSGVIPPDSEEELLPMGDISKIVTDESIEKANECRDLANAAFSESDFEKAFKHYTQAIELNPGSSILHARRANVLLHLCKPLAAIRDCNKAIELNPDSAQGYKFRGRANRLLGNWLAAHSDLSTACKLDYDDTANEWLKEVLPNAKKLQEYERAKKRLAEEKELQDRRARVERAQEANKRARDEAAARGDMHEDKESGGFGMGGFTELLKELGDDPELLKMMKDDPSLIGKISEIMQNPSNIMKHMGDPAVQKLLGKLGSKFGAEGPSSDFSTESDKSPESSPTKKAPEPELD